MRPVITAADVERLLRAGESVESIPADAILTPSAQDLLRSRRLAARPSFAKASAAAKAMADKSEGRSSQAAAAVPHACDCSRTIDLKNPAAIQTFFNSPAVEAVKAQMCDIGRRMWEKDYVDGNGGNITARVAENLVLCTPTLISKGFMKPCDMCLIDMEGNQVAGTKKRTSEALTHLGIMKRQPKARACVHAHPVHATAFAVASVIPPSCLIPEAEVFLGEIGMAEYQTPGTPANGKAVGEVGVNHQVVLMQNHGVITWGDSVEDAHWKMENIDAYCRTVWIASQLGSPLHSFGADKLKELIAIRQKLGMSDPRAGTKDDCQLCDPGDYRGAAVSQPT
jgi:L-fuculose-phosphate aldolase